MSEPRTGMPGGKRRQAAIIRLRDEVAQACKDGAARASCPHKGMSAYQWCYGFDEQAAKQKKIGEAEAGIRDTTFRALDRAENYQRGAKRLARRPT